MAKLSKMKEKLSAARRDYEAIQAKFLSLEVPSLDEQGNLMVGKYWCIHRNNWEKGFTFLMRGNDDRFEYLAETELTEPVDPRVQFKIAEGWWDIGISSGPGAERNQFLERAAQWYKRADGNMDDSIEKESARMATSGGYYDCVVIGAGHNGLITAAYLAKAGKKVAVLERRHVLGGCSTTEELWPGFKVSTASYVVSLLLPEIIRDLKLKQNGLKILPRDPASFTPTDDGRYLLLGHDVDSNAKEIAKFSQSDAENYPKYNELLERIAAVVEPILMQTAPDPLPMPKDWRSIPITKRIRDTSRLWNFYQTFGKLGGEIPEAIELLSGAARPILERWFESEPLRATLATDAIIGAFASISSPGTAYVLLHHVMGEAGGKR
ncbi:PYROXD2, partial [Symbiodinium microadriaticum]